MAKQPKVGIVKVGSTRVILAPERVARLLVDTGKYAYNEAKPVPAPAPAAAPYEEFDSLTYWQVRKLAEERGVEVEGRTKADYLAALRGSYGRRDMRADD